MNAHASPLKTDFQDDASLGAVLDVLGAHGDKPLALAYGDGQQVQAGYHVTEIKAGSFVTLDCGGNPNAWRETVLQVEDIPANQGSASMTVAKFQSILGKVGSRVQLDRDARLTWEVSRPGDPMGIYDVAGIEIERDRAIVRLSPRPAICKPRHRARQAGAPACCG
ncbi:DUF6428 family protein [Pelagibacterium halotolerans]|uniref:Uncharacterized protein n=1 Tax=Pelagibacterium halotolerans (strain DSM 22347 / JCM 15775 / CGMCC 1.7692 / B2) TaxID=1082931 RepID=G4RCY9_PELHB|nr:DUF6428 family protein [Pelagibacterium halotolerans]AEQ52772.1 hypothetical protein KKY_2766 [Pelagibacterium halotolerans B2]QJR17532.1 hypothetical protein HKM20_03200 [Pelagibacterium halotolerans]SEA76412.1 hypothetical protein SAMN05428936_107196 [Pelagibacterium halotolerans]